MATLWDQITGGIGNLVNGVTGSNTNTTTTTTTTQDAAAQKSSNTMIIVVTVVIVLSIAGLAIVYFRTQKTKAAAA